LANRVEIPAAEGGVEAPEPFDLRVRASRSHRLKSNLSANTNTACPIRHRKIRARSVSRHPLARSP
jgi:hypothetical protein